MIELAQGLSTGQDGIEIGIANHELHKQYLEKRDHGHRKRH